MSTLLHPYRTDRKAEAQAHLLRAIQLGHVRPPTTTWSADSKVLSH